MPKQAYVFSTLANDQRYTDWIPGGGNVPTMGMQVLIKGGANVANDRVMTPLGVCTTVSEDELAFLERHKPFTDHKAAGHIVVRMKDADPEKVAADMNRSDPSAPITPSHYTNAGEGVAVPKDA